jgi:PPK2 family polyphosphate:nucleotide phosphotransferase
MSHMTTPPTNAAARHCRLLEDIIHHCRVGPGEHVRLADRDAAWAGDTSLAKRERKKLAEELLSENVAELAEAQRLLYADNSWAVLLVFQALDAAGKDGTIRHVMSGVNPQGCQVFSFKQPSQEELDHDFLWRAAKVLPERGRIGIFNRSYYEEVLVVRVHPKLLAAQRIPNTKPIDPLWQERYESINDFERHLARNGTKIIKFFLHISKKEQRERFLKRIENPDKHWKFSAGDVRERDFWEDYTAAYEEMLSATSTEHAPWYVIPADHKWVTRALVANVVSSTIDSLNLRYPEPSPDELQELKAAAKKLREE